jgi:hypothetical protein
MKKMTPGHGPAPDAGVNTEAGHVPSRVVIETAVRDMARHYVTSRCTAFRNARRCAGLGSIRRRGGVEISLGKAASADGTGGFATGARLGARFGSQYKMHRRTDTPREPIERDVGEQRILRDDGFDVAVAIAPRTKLLDDVSRKARGRIRERVGERLRLRSLVSVAPHCLAHGRPTNVQEMHGVVADPRDELRKRIEASFLRAPIELVAPIGEDVAEIRKIGAVRRVRYDCKRTTCSR